IRRPPQVRSLRSAITRPGRSPEALARSTIPSNRTRCHPAPPPSTVLAVVLVCAAYHAAELSSRASHSEPGVAKRASREPLSNVGRLWDILPAIGFEEGNMRAYATILLLLGAAALPAQQPAEIPFDSAQ